MRRRIVLYRRDARYRFRYEGSGRLGTYPFLSLQPPLGGMLATMTPDKESKLGAKVALPPVISTK